MKTVTLDCLYEACPLPLIKAVEKLKTMEIGEVLIIETDHTCALTHISDWARDHRVPYDSVKVADGEWRIFLEKVREASSA